MSIWNDEDDEYSNSGFDVICTYIYMQLSLLFIYSNTRPLLRLSDGVAGVVNLFELLAFLKISFLFIVSVYIYLYINKIK